MKTIDRETLLALDNMAILYRAAAAGMKVFPEDQFVNYAEIDLQLEQLEDEAVKKAAKDLQDHLDSWLQKIEDPKDVIQDDLQISKIFYDRTMDHIRSVWNYGESEADAELQRMNVASNGEVQIFASGSPTSTDDTWNDAFEWYEEYIREVSKKAETDLWQHMQPTILEHIENGTVRLGLRDALLDDFTRIGVVRADIIARTESSKAFNWGRRYRFDQSPSLAGYRYSSIMDERTTPICRGLHGHSWEKADPELDGYTPPNHFRCRSILVPISKYVDFAFDPPDEDFLDAMDDLSDKQKEAAKKMLTKFKDAAFYPKRSTVGEAAKATGKTPAAPAAPAPVAATTEQLNEIAAQSHIVAAEYYQELVDYNVKRGLSKSHPSILAWQAAADEIRAGKYKGKMIMAEWSPKAKNKVALKEFAQDGGVFVRFQGVTAADKAKVQKEINIIKNDPLFAGIKIEYKKSKTKNGSYQAANDFMMMNTHSRGLQTLYHEIGHRVHNNPSLYTSSYDGLLRKNNINITPETWDKWQKKTEAWWDPKLTPMGTEALPNDLRRFEYPINAKYYYTKGTKANYQKEMFAEVTSVYLEGDPEEIRKVKRTYPGLLEFMESEVFKRGIIK